jgi:hypothetical protein
MTTTARLARLIVPLLILLALCGAAAGARDDAEQRKIDYLISSLEHLSGATFVRNGSEHPAKEAVGHLRKKLKYAGDHVQSAQDFIVLCASKSSISGKPYLIRFTDGKTTTSEAFFREQLTHYRAIPRK